VKKTILLIDDDPLVLKSITNLLQSKGYEVYGCKSGLEGAKVFEGRKVDLVVSDIRMKDPDGIATVKGLREIERRKELSPIPVIMMTGYASEDAPVHAIKLGIRDYFLKPFDTKELLESIASHLKKDGEPARFTVLGIGIISPLGFTKEAFWKSVDQCRPFYREVSGSESSELNGSYCMRIEGFKPGDYFDEKQLHNLDSNSIFIAAAAKLAIQDSQLKVSKIGSDDIGVSVGTSVSIGTSMSDFDESVLREGYRRSKIGIFPNTVMCAPASRVSIFEHITGSNTTISSGMNSGIDAIGHACFCVERNLSKIMITGGSDALSEKILLGYSKEGLLLRQLNGRPRNKRGSFIPSEGACTLVLGKLDPERPEPQVYAEILSYACGFSPASQRDTKSRAHTLRTVLADCLDRGAVEPEDIDCALLSAYFDEYDYDTELAALESLFEGTIDPKLILAPKRILGESLAAYAPQLVVLAIGLFKQRISPQAIRYLAARSHFRPTDKIKNALVVHVDAAGHQSALVLKSHEG
jgi:3-oxoacyl-[acyl-carrier-protein] synthase II